MKLPDLLWLNQLKLVRKLNEQNVFMARKTGFALNVEEMEYVKLMEKTNMRAKSVVVQLIVIMENERADVKIVVEDQFASMGKKSIDVKIVEDLALVLILVTNLDARFALLLALDTMFNVVLIAFYWIQTLEDPAIVDPRIS